MDKLSIKDNFNTLIKATNNLIRAASRGTQTPQYSPHDTEPKTIWRLVQTNLKPTPYGFVLENNDNKPPILRLIPPAPILDEHIALRQPPGSPQLLITPNHSMARIEQLYSAWFDVFYEVSLPLTIAAHQACQGTSNIWAPEANNLYYYDTITVTSRIDIAQEVPDTTASLNQTSYSWTSRFDSWTLLCQGTGRRYPTTDDILRSTNYAKRPKSFKTEPGAKTNTDCRICKTLHSSGTHKDELYVNHYGNSPTHCPQWTKMDLAERARIAKLAQYCPRCFAPRLIIKRNNCNKHLQNRCYVSSTKKHKFTCLNKTCLKHSWICQDHIDKNKPLIDAHIEEFNLQSQQTPTPTSQTPTIGGKTTL